jgi:hypothetical protein
MMFVALISYMNIWYNEADCIFLYGFVMKNETLAWRYGCTKTNAILYLSSR